MRGRPRRGAPRPVARPEVPARRRVPRPGTGEPGGPRARTALAVPALVLLALALAIPARAQFHRAEQDREITYWLLEPSTHQFRISHDFTVDTPGQRHVHSFVRAGSEVTGAEVWDLDAGERLPTENVTGADVNALGIYPNPSPDDQVVVQAELAAPVGEGETRRVRVVETYTDRERYTMDGEELVWDRTLGRPYNTVKLPPGWMLTSVSVPATISLDGDGLVSLRFINPRNDSLRVVIRARPRPGG